MTYRKPKNTDNSKPENLNLKKDNVVETEVIAESTTDKINEIKSEPEPVNLTENKNESDTVKSTEIKKVALSNDEADVPEMEFENINTDVDDDREDDGKKSAKRAKVIKTVSLVAFILDAVLVATLIFLVIDFNILPTSYLIVAILGLVVLALIPALLIFIPKKKNVFKIIGAVLALILCFVFAVGSFYIIITNRAIETITSEGYSIKIFKVAVPKKDNIEELKECTDYTFGTISSYEAELFPQAMEAINDEAGTTLKTKDYEEIDDLLNGLYKGEVDGIIYEGTLGGVFDDLNEDFYEDVEVIFDVSLKRPMTEVEIERQAAIESLAAEKATETTTMAETTETTTKETTEETTAEATDEIPEMENFVCLISGNDEYDEVSVTGRSDVNMLVVVNFDTHQVLLVSIPRDYYVPIAWVSDGERDKLTHASVYGMDVLCETVGELMDTTIDYYVRVNFTSVAEIIDAIGGLAFYNPYYFKCTYYDYEFYEGEVWCDGWQALQYARERKSLENGDFGRGEHQQIIIEAMIDKLVSAESIAHYGALVDAIDSCAVTTMPEEKIKAIVKYQLATGEEWEIIKAQVSGEEFYQPCFSMDYMELAVIVPYQETVDYAKELIQRVKNGEVLTQEEVDNWSSETLTYACDVTEY